jgi:PKHD-type hydroxylase
MLDTNYPNSSWALKVDSLERWAFIDNLFTQEECDKIIDIGTSHNLTIATVGSKQLGKSVVNSDIRKSQVVFLKPTSNMTWVYTRITDAINSLNDQYFKFDLWGIAEGLQFTEYKAPDGNYEAHTDRVYGSIVRKLSFVIQLSDPSTYEGGNFEIIDGKDPEILPRKRGAIFAFPSYTLHRVTPVTKNVRYSLVGWVTGKQFT